MVGPDQRFTGSLSSILGESINLNQPTSFDDSADQILSNDKLENSRLT